MRGTVPKSAIQHRTPCSPHFHQMRTFPSSNISRKQHQRSIIAHYAHHISSKCGRFSLCATHFQQMRGTQTKTAIHHRTLRVPHFHQMRSFLVRNPFNKKQRSIIAHYAHRISNKCGRFTLYAPHFHQMRGTLTKSAIHHRTLRAPHFHQMRSFLISNPSNKISDPSSHIMRTAFPTNAVVSHYAHRISIKCVVL